MLLNIKGVSLDKKLRKDRRLQGRYSIDGHTYSVYGKTQEEVVEKLEIAVDKIIKSHKSSQKKERTKIQTTEEWLREYFDVFKKNNRPKTKEEQRRYIKVISTEFGKTPINRLDALKLQSFFDNITGTRMRELIFIFFNAALEKAANLRKIPANPLDNIEVKKHRYSEKYALTRNEQKIFMQLVKGNQHELRFLLMLEAGLRPSEALAISKEDFDMTKKIVIVNKSIAEDSKTKTEGSKRIIPLSNVLEKAFFSIPFSAPITTRSLNRAFRVIADKMNLANGYTSYTLRHTFSTRLEEAGVSRKVIATLLGNSEEVARRHYIHVLDEFSVTEWQKYQNGEKKFDT